MKYFKQDDVELEDPIAAVGAENEKDLSVEEMSEVERIEHYLKCVKAQTRAFLRDTEARVRTGKLYAHKEKQAKEICRDIYYEDSS